MKKGKKKKQETKLKIVHLDGVLEQNIVGRNPGTDGGAPRQSCVSGHAYDAWGCSPQSNIEKRKGRVLERFSDVTWRWLATGVRRLWDWGSRRRRRRSAEVGEDSPGVLTIDHRESFFRGKLPILLLFIFFFLFLFSFFPVLLVFPVFLFSLDDISYFLDLRKIYMILQNIWDSILSLAVISFEWSATNILYEKT